MTRSSPSRARCATRCSSRHEPTLASTFGTDGTPASLPSRTVLVFESMNRRSDAFGWMTRSPTWRASASLSSSNMTNAASPRFALVRMNASTSGWRRSSLVISSMDVHSWYGRECGTNTRGWVPSKLSYQLTKKKLRTQRSMPSRLNGVGEMK